MDAQSRLQQICREWKRLAEAECDAIRVGNWHFQTECQDALRALQPRLSFALGEIRKQIDAQPGAKQSLEESVRVLREELLTLQRRNLAMIESRHDKLGQRRARLDLAQANIRRLKRSYTGPTPAAWSSVS